MFHDVNPAILPRIARTTDTKILFVVLDGLGGGIGSVPTALERAKHPHLDALARAGPSAATSPSRPGSRRAADPGTSRSSGTTR